MPKPIVSFDEQAVKDECASQSGKPRGCHHRDVPRRGVHAPHRGHQRDPVGRRRLRQHDLKSEQEGAQSRRLEAPPAADLRLSACLHRRNLPEAQLGRLYENVAVMVATGQAPLSPLEASRNHLSPGPDRKGPGSPWCDNASRGYASRTRHRTPGVPDAVR